MRKYRSWFMGLGIGIILGASMLQVIQFAKNQAAMVAGEPMTPEQLDTAAKNAGLVLLPAGQTMYTQDQLKAKIDEAVAAVRETGKTDNNGIKDSKGSLKPPAPSQSPESEDPKAITFYIRKNMTLSEVGKKLEELGVIDNAQDFIKKAEPIAKKLNVGTAVFTGKPTYERIMAELTREKY
jgi:ABC-type transport system substrate-binding protein